MTPVARAAERRRSPRRRSANDTSAVRFAGGRTRGPDAEGAPRFLTGRAHGDPFPLPLLGRSTPREVLPLNLSSGVRR
eukprot:7340156-Pyramimonas_sp.AAC.1